MCKEFGSEGKKVKMALAALLNFEDSSSPSQDFVPFVFACKVTLLAFPNASDTKEMPRITRVNKRLS